MRRRFVVATVSPAASEFGRYYLLLVFSESLRLDDVSGATSFELVATLRFELATGSSREREKRCVVLSCDWIPSCWFSMRSRLNCKMSGQGRGRRDIPLGEENPDDNASITQLLRLLVEQTSRGNGQSSSSRGPSNDDPQEKFRRQKPKEFSGTTDPLVAESWIKSMEVIFKYLQVPDLDRPRCAIYMLRDDAMILVGRS
ncbi:hypothetical protein F511_38089 [Dorcoceras hygrometricum]|uniref:Gag-protease polyprotein n=1 Tax=Dorcoceras hygrometricum TaxID=472368 RepID=A0A2Z7BX46_9LAMI|nr:hypothetical protein F511_38089 [Dorcoceras hygrometricum]